MTNESKAPEFEAWLARATRGLSAASTAQARTEITEHYESAVEAAIHTGAAERQAHVSALAALGNPKTANCEYRKVLLTSAEARMLRESNWEARAVCSRTWAKRLLLGLPLAALAGAVFLYGAEAFKPARVLSALGIAMALVVSGPFLPVYTPLRARIFRSVKCAMMVSAVLMAFGAGAAANPALTLSVLWPLAWIEWTRMSIRRKLPVAKWPRQLYL